MELTKSYSLSQLHKVFKVDLKCSGVTRNVKDPYSEQGQRGWSSGQGFGENKF